MSDSSSAAPINAEKLDKLAQLAVQTGLGLRPGQDLIMTAPLTALPLVRKITEHAYKAGAGLVTTIYSDEQTTLSRYRHGNDEAFDHAADWLFEGMAKAFSNNTARLAIAGDNPMMLAEEDPDRVSRAQRATSRAYKPASKKITSFETNWNIVAYPTPKWATLVFPDLSEDAAVAKLSEAIFAASRSDNADPVAAWTAHNADIHARRDWLNAKNFRDLHFTGPGTDLVIGLADDHKWAGGASLAKNGITCNPNIPSEEVFTTPHARRVDGHVRATKPLAHNGSVIENIEMVFKDGLAVEVRASRGEEIWNKVLDTDEGGRRLGEVALVPNSSPISQSGILFYNTLFDENAACHIAMGQCYSECIAGGDKLTEEQIAEKGGNASLIHIDWMIGSAEIDIDGITHDGDRVPVFRKGEWAF
ncbi:aminopeptidase [Pelagibacterium lacus]|uniref:Aminopeptidase n=1 Tax=Pelagibacterium lacus TaxID=2282655 RepID=A0A369W7K1_9HYPH|nr:aminopeptidase [Pelagibacterium lacus]RDE09222.1 aminopeptidase [Pelagibacterium lacus]